MEKNIFNVFTEPKGSVYHQLINHSLKYCDKAILIIRQSIELSFNANYVLDILNPFLIDNYESTEWPGTKLLDGSTALVNNYNLNRDCTKILCESANGLYSWQLPRLPEDLCLLRYDGTAWLVSISHEQDSYLELSIEERNCLLEQVPDLKLKEYK